ncbi:unnamed protein product [Cuscuta epithymum]|uniref:RNA-directed DNA polymerase n=1 Tax=Cuscuta epithymum TaxID=186058 RepID=A0AAV0DEE1_9ASTE|nr:unnamed protein product [Cuscuta epithymum]
MQVKIFTAGLRELVRMEVEYQDPLDLDTAMMLARTVERKYQTPTASTDSIIRPQPSSRPNASGTTLIDSSLSRRSSNPTFKKISRAEAAIRREKGLCYNCDDQWVRGHRCKRLFFVEIVEDDQLEEDHTSQTAIEPTLSLHAMTGFGSSSTMQIHATLQNRPIIILVDSGSTHNFVHERLATNLINQPLRNNRLHVIVANGDKVPIIGTCPGLEFEVQGKTFTADFYILPLAGFDMILGVHWLRGLGSIMWDFTRLSMRFTWEDTSVEWHGHDVSPPLTATMAVGLAQTPPSLAGLLVQFEDLFRTPVGLPPKRTCDHRIRLIPGAGPVVVRPYRYPYLQKDEIERQCAEMITQGIIQPSRSPFSSPVLLVLKSDDSWRFCVDYRELNSKTVKDKFPIPVIDELLDELHGASYFTKLDLRSGYHQIRMAPEDIEKTAFRTHHGHFEFLVMPFGLSNAPSTFQSLMNDILAPYLRKFVLVFFDDILIYSKSWTAHVAHVRHVLDILRTHNLFLKESKCSFGATSVNYLGHVIHAGGVEVDRTKIQAIMDWPTPQSVTALRSFLGLAGYYRKFIARYGEIAAPLSTLLKKNGFDWSAAANSSFCQLKTCLSTAPVLQLPDFSKEFIVECDASRSGFGAVLQQEGHPIAYFSRKIADRHIKLAAYERELIGLAKAVTHWRPYLWGQQFLIRTDHSSLKYLLEQRLTTSPQQHWLSKLMGFTFRVEYKPGRFNTVADALSRQNETPLILASLTVPLSTLLDEVRTAQAASPEIEAIQQQVLAGTTTEDWTFQDGLLYYKHKLYLLPSSNIIPSILSVFHGMAHEGIEKTLHRLRKEFYWPNMKLTVA